MHRLPSLNALRAFETTARLGSVKAAAEALHVTPSAVSHQLKRLEDDLGLVLLERNARRLALTDAGEAYFRELTVLFAQIVAATDRLRRRRQQDVVTVTTLPVFAIKWLVRRLANFHRAHPDIEVRISTSYRVLDLHQGDYDLGVRWGSGRWRNLEVMRLMGDRVQPVCSPAFFAANAPLKLPAQLKRHRLIHMAFIRDDWRIWAESFGIAPPDARGLRFNEPMAAIQAAIDGLGLALGPRALVDDELSAGRLVAAHEEPLALGEAYHVAWPARAQLSRAAQLFRDWLVQVCAEFEGALPAATPRLQAGRVTYPRSRE